MEEKQTKFHVDHKLWSQSLDFYVSEIEFFKRELSQVVMKNDQSYSKIEYVEEYKVIFQKKLDHIQELREAISNHEKKLGDCSNEEQDTEHHNAMKIKFDEFVNRFETLKKNFRRFASHND